MRREKDRDNAIAGTEIHNTSMLRKLGKATEQNRVNREPVAVARLDDLQPRHKQVVNTFMENRV